VAAVAVAAALAGGGDDQAASVAKCGLAPNRTTVRDPVGDVFSTVHGRPGGPDVFVRRPDIDIRSFGFARRGDTLCIEVTTDAPPKPRDSFTVTIDARFGRPIPPDTESTLIIAIPKGTQEGRSRVGADPHGYLPAEIRRRGTRTVVGVDTRGLPEHSLNLLASPLSISVVSQHGAPIRSRADALDDVPNRGRADYPPKP
jgi:hypothetical protein